VAIPTVHSAVEDSALTPFLKRLTVYSSGGPFLDGYVLVIIGIALIQLEPQLELDAFWTGLIGASALVGLLLGGAVFGYVTDLMGRQLMYQIDLIAIIVFSVAQMFVANAWQLLLLRFLIGIAVGADYPIATSLLAEFSPRRYRGALLGLLICAWYVGAVAASFVGYGMLATGPDAWRWMLGSAAAPALLLVLGRWNTPESPRWLISKGRRDKALEIVRTVWGPAATLADLQETDQEPTSYRKIFTPGYLERTMFVGLFWTFQVIPLFAIYTFGPQILEAFNLGQGNLWIVGYALINVFFLIGCIPPLLLLNTLGRRPTIVWSFFFMTVSLLLLGVFPGAPPWFILCCFLAYAFFSGGPSVLCWIYPNELFPTDVRATAVGVGTGISRIGAAIGTFSLPYVLRTYGIGATMLISAALTFLGFIVCVWWAPETKGLSLHESSALKASET
jgi:MFS transporter, putative metabolite transport protein